MQEIKPSQFIEWATNTDVELRGGGQNKIEPDDNFKLVGSLSGEVYLNHFNWLFNNAGLWTQFLSHLIQTSDGDGVGVAKDNSMILLFALDKISPANRIVALGYKNGINAPTFNTIDSNVLEIGTPTGGGNVPIINGTAPNIILATLNFKI